MEAVSLARRGAGSSASTAATVLVLSGKKARLAENRVENA